MHHGGCRLLCVKELLGEDLCLRQVERFLVVRERIQALLFADSALVLHLVGLLVRQELIVDDLESL